MEPLQVALRGLFAYVFLLAVTRLSGKRTISQATVFQFVVALVVGDLVDDLLWAEVAAAEFSVAAGTIAALGVLNGEACRRWPRVARVLGDAPVLLVRNGRLVHPGARRERLREEKVAMLMRQAGVPRERWKDVAEGWIDGGGKPAAVLRRDAQEADYATLRELRRPIRTRTRS